MPQKNVTRFSLATMFDPSKTHWGHRQRTHSLMLADMKAGERPGQPLPLRERRQRRLE